MLKSMVLTALCWLSLASALAAAPDGFHGMPFLKRFSPSDYRGSPSSSDLLASRDGYVYLANRRGLLRFDGSRWALMRMPGQVVLSALGVGVDGSIYLGGIDSFGKLQVDAAGEMHYVELSAGFAVGDKPNTFGTVWTILGTARGMYFRTDDRLLFLGADGSRLHWPMPEDVRRLFSANEQLLARVEGRGLSRWNDGEFRLLEGGERFADVGIAEIVASAKGPLVVSDAGFFRIEGDRVQQIEGAEHAALLSYVPNTAVELGDGGVVVGTERGDLLHFDGRLRLTAAYPVSRHSIDHLGIDREGGTWMAGQSLLGRIEIPSRWGTYAESHGLSGEAMDTLYFDGALWVGTTEGLFRGRREQHKVRFEKRIEGAAYQMLDDPTGMLVVDDQGVLLVPASRRSGRRLIEDVSAYYLQRSRFDPANVFVYAGDQLRLLRREPGGWQLRAEWPLDDIDISGLVEESAERFWLGDYRGGPQRWSRDPLTQEITRREEFGLAQGLQVDPAFGTSVQEYRGVLYAVSGNGVFKWSNERFEESSDAPFSLVSEPSALSVVETPLGDFAFTERELFRRESTSPEWQRLHLGDPLAQGFSQVEMDADGKLRVISWGGVLQFDPDVPETLPPVLHVDLQRAVREPVHGEPVNVLERAGAGLKLPPDELLRLSFGMGSLESPSELRYRVKGLINSWSPWTLGETQLTLRYPGPGQFTLEVEGRTLTGRQAIPLRVAIDAPPRWWQTPAAWISGLVLASGLTLLLSWRFQHYRDQRDEAWQAANSDALTGVYNRRAAQSRLRLLAHKARGRPVTFAVLFVDIDHFKSINDRYGHAAGDQCLKAVAERVRRELRGGDALARWGGEEFLVLLDGAAAADAHRIAERIRTRIAEGAIEAEGQAIAVTVSIGVAVFLSSEDTVDKVVARADAALYEAKSSGRNRVMPSLQALAG